MVFAISPSAAICEELIYRGFVLVLLGTAIGPWAANGVQALLFGFHHGGVRQGLPALLTRVAIGFAFGAIAIVTHTLMVVIALHFLIDALLALKPSAAVKAAA